MINQVAGLVDFTTLRINSSQTALYQYNTPLKSDHGLS